MKGNYPYITNLVNSIIGVSVLAMPYCLKQCGIVLGLGLLLSAAWLTYLSCSMLASSAYQKRRRSYEYLALFTLGPTGKFCVELSMIGLMLGTCIAFYVVIGDLSHGTVAKFVPGADAYTLRMYTIIFTALCIALPLGNMKDLSILSYFGFCSLIFYLAFLVVVVLNAVSSGFLQWEWMSKVNLWRPAGIFQCLPIFSLAYACQCQLFIVYSSLEEPTVHRVEEIVFGAIRFVTVAYMSIGFFGYTTYQEAIAGNLLLNFPSNILLDFIKMGFAMSVVLGFPLMISPCRQSIHTLIFAPPAGEGVQTTTYIPPFLFKSITLGIVILTMTVAIVIPNVETILGLTGATMGSLICFIFPALIYEKVHSKTSSNMPKFVFVLGCVLLVVCTYSNLSKVTDPAAVESVAAPVVPDPPIVIPDEVKVPAIDSDENEKDLVNVPPDDTKKLEDEKQAVAEVEGPDHRHEPPNPVEPDNVPVLKEEDAPVDDAKDIKDEKAPVQPQDSHEKQESEKELPANPPAEDNAKIPLPVKDEEKKEDSVVADQPKNPIDEAKIQHPNEHAVDSQPKSEEADVKNPIVPKQNEAPDKLNPGEAPVDKESQKKLSPQIIQKDEVVQPAADSQEKVNRDAQPGLQQGSPLKKQNVEINVDSHKVDQKDLSKNADETGSEKKLLEKIKEQHDMQQQLLIEQEQLIKKLEEHQDQKDQAGKEDGQDGRIEQNGHQGPPSERQQEIVQPLNMSDMEQEKQRIINPVSQKPQVVNSEGPIVKKHDDSAPQGGPVKNHEQADSNPRDIVKSDGIQEEIPEIPRNKVIAGRELLSEDKVMSKEKDLTEENDDGDELSDENVHAEVRVNPPNKLPVSDSNNLAMQNMKGNNHMSDRSKIDMPLNPAEPLSPLKQHRFPSGKLFQPSKNSIVGRPAMTIEQQRLRAQRYMEYAARNKQDTKNKEVSRKARDVGSQSDEGNTQEIIHDTEANPQSEYDEFDTGLEMKVSKKADDSQEMEHNMRQSSKTVHQSNATGDGDFDVKLAVKATNNREDDPVIEQDSRDTFQIIDQNQQNVAGSPILSELRDHDDGDEEPGMKEIVDSEIVADNPNPLDKAELKLIETSCLESDLECWQSKSKLGNLNSFNFN